MRPAESKRRARVRRVAWARARTMFTRNLCMHHGPDGRRLGNEHFWRDVDKRVVLLEERAKRAAAVAS